MAAVEFIDPQLPAVTVQNIFCIGRNYAAHIAELGNRPAAAPVVFLKPTSAILHDGQTIELPAFSTEVHFETELVLLIGKGGKNIEEASALSHVSGYGLGLDLTARDIQNKAKQEGLPWAVGKGFDHSACISKFIPVEQLGAPETLVFSLNVNGERRQHGETKNMLYTVPHIIAYLSQIFTLQAGDLIYTGTPEGVAALHSGDHLVLSLQDVLHAEFSVA
ncbi:MAG: fumarylacetoacetate hydrolase family protein [Burkholderiales bacterium]|jgi:2-keto-4-pentenoate hydratase/2-oxohepta-3-ene-1,7-dioic acid hydratase in catechol pathway|nr:fumarylacetoacetate hydrolase family protein [Burkholderiales bacterium]